MLEKHPVARRIGFAATALSTVASSAGMIYHIMALEEVVRENAKALAAVRGDQGNIRGELSLQTADLEEIRQTQGRIIGRFDKIEANHLWLSRQIGEGSVSMAIELGRVMERTEKP